MNNGWRLQVPPPMFMGGVPCKTTGFRNIAPQRQLAKLLDADEQQAGMLLTCMQAEPNKDSKQYDATNSS